MTTSITQHRIQGTSAFVVIWIGQLISILASQMSQFALTVWAFERTGSVATIGFVQVAYVLPILLVTPIVGVMVDRYNRKLMMMLSDLGAVLATGGLLLAAGFGELALWHLYLASAVNGLFGAFQWPAYSASISLMVPKDRRSRVNGMMSLMEQGPGVLAPTLAALIYPLLGLSGILSIDFATFFVALSALALVVVPQPPQPDENATETAKPPWMQEVSAGFRYMFAHRGLLGLQMVYFFANLSAGLMWTSLSAMVLARTNNNESLLGIVRTAGAIGVIGGGILMSTWRGFDRRIHGLLLGWAVCGAAMLVLGFGQSVWVWAAGLLLLQFTMPVASASTQTIWQNKTAPNVIGRVFAARRLIAWMPAPIMPIVSGLLADQYFEPAMRSGSSPLGSALGTAFGIGPGAGIGVMMALAGIGCIAVGLGGYAFRSLRNVEIDLPDQA